MSRLSSTCAVISLVHVSATGLLAIYGDCTILTALYIRGFSSAVYSQ